MQQQRKPNAQPAFSFDWSGLAPAHGVCPGVDAQGKIHALPQLRLDASRAAWLDYFNNGWTMTEVLFSALATEDAYFKRPYHQLRHPLIFYLGHPAALYVNKLRVAGLFNKPIDAALEALFETGVDEMRWDDLYDGSEDIWPSVGEVMAYRREVYAQVVALINTHPFLDAAHLPVTQQSPMWALAMGFEHERIHLETSSVLMRELPLEYLRRPKAWPEDAPHTHAPSIAATTMRGLEAAQVTLGKPQAYPTYGWDNEYGSETRHVRAFEASDALISNGEFLEFVKAGGYADERYWTREGWGWRRFRNVKWPTFWLADGPSGAHLYKLRTLFDAIDLPRDWPAIVNFHEAKAYCAWRSENDGGGRHYRLLTEGEHHRLRTAPAGQAPTGNLHIRYGSESPVRAMPANPSGFHDVFGNVWQWCEDHFHPLEGAKPHPYYDDFSTPCYDGEHQMILGGSFMSTGDMAEPWARFHFRPHFFQHAGFRIARNTDGDASSGAIRIQNRGADTYEDREMLDRYLLMHWGTDAEIFAHVPIARTAWPLAVNLPVTCAALVKEYAMRFNAALDLGCAVGRSSFEMARDFNAVVGIDYSDAFIASANTLKEAGSLAYTRKDSGDRTSALTAVVDPAIDRTRLTFAQGDACDMPLHYHNFDAVLLANVLCRLPDPKACLERMQGVNGLVAPGGVLVMTTPFSWLESYTPRARWLDGIEAVAGILTQFELIHQQELPFLIREHARKFESIITHASVWRRKT